MPRESAAAKAARVKQIIAGLIKAYPNAHCELNHSNPLELLIATILSAQCTDKRVNLVTPALFKKYRSAADYAKASDAELEQAPVLELRFVAQREKHDEPDQVECRVVEGRRVYEVVRATDRMHAPRK